MSQCSSSNSAVFSSISFFNHVFTGGVFFSKPPPSFLNKKKWNLTKRCPNISSPQKELNMIISWQSGAPPEMDFVSTKKGETNMKCFLQPASVKTDAGNSNYSKRRQSVTNIHYNVVCCTELYCVLHCTAHTGLYHTIQYCTIVFATILYSPILHYDILLNYLLFK